MPEAGERVLAAAAGVTLQAIGSSHEHTVVLSLCHCAAGAVG